MCKDLRVSSALLFLVGLRQAKVVDGIHVDSYIHHGIASRGSPLRSHIRWSMWKTCLFRVCSTYNIVSEIDGDWPYNVSRFELETAGVKHSSFQVYKYNLGMVMYYPVNASEPLGTVSQIEVENRC